MTCRRSVFVSLLLVATATFGQSSGRSPSHPLLTGYFLQGGIYEEPKYTLKTLVDTGGAGLLDQLNYSQGAVAGGHCSIADPNADLNYVFTAEQSLNGIGDLPTASFRGNFHQLVELKRRYPHIKLVISLEGRASSFAEDARPENREAFVRSCIALFLKGNFAPGVSMPGLFDGIDIDWEYPHKENAANFLPLLSEFRRQMDALRPGLLLTIAVGWPGAYEGSDLATLNSLVDEVGLMTYDYAGPWSHITGFNAPLRAATHNNGTVAGSVASWRAAGIPASKLLLGLPFYGYGWHMVEESNNGLFQEGEPVHGDHPFRDIQELAQHSVVYRDDLSQAPWLFDGDNFWTYEDPISIHKKAQFVHEEHLGGVMIWQLGDDSANALLLHSTHAALSLRSGSPPALLSTSPAPSASPTAVTVPERPGTLR